MPHVPKTMQHAFVRRRVSSRPPLARRMMIPPSSQDLDVGCCRTSGPWSPHAGQQGSCCCTARRVQLVESLQHGTNSSIITTRRIQSPSARRISCPPPCPPKNKTSIRQRSQAQETTTRTYAAAATHQVQQHQPAKHHSNI